MGDAYAATTLSPIRKVIAARMTEAKRTIPHFRLGIDVAVDALLDLRKDLRRQHPDTTLSLNDLLTKACATALMDAPAVNIQWVEDEIRQYYAADISIVTAIQGGLSAPIVRNADSKSVLEISSELKELRSRAARGALRMEEISGGSFSVSNLGMCGVDQFDAIINPPQCAILAVGQAKPRVVASANGDINVATVLQMTLSVDHRVLDGATAAAFLSSLRRRIEEPGHMLPANGGR